MQQKTLAQVTRGGSALARYQRIIVGGTQFGSRTAPAPAAAHQPA